MSCVCGQPSHSDEIEACTFCNQRGANVFLTVFLGLVPHPGLNNRVIFQCSCGNYELHSTVDGKDGYTCPTIEKTGWRRISDKWECPDCLTAEKQC